MPLTLPTAPFAPTQLIAGSKTICVFTPSTPTQQVETATLTGGNVTVAGNVVVTITGSLIVGSPLAINVAVLVGDTLAMVAAKIRLVLAATTAVTNFYTVTPSLSGVQVQLTAITGAADEGAFNIGIGVGTQTGVTASPTSVTTVAGSTGGTPINIPCKMTELANKTETTERQVPGTDGVMRPDRQMTKSAREEFSLTDIEEIDSVLTNFTSFTGLNRLGTCVLWVMDQTDQAGVSVRLKSAPFPCSLIVKSGTTKFGGGDFTKVSILLLSLAPAGVVWTVNATS
jgi:hypothetical protein